jgi:hypothetical protein
MDGEDDVEYKLVLYLVYPLLGPPLIRSLLKIGLDGATYIVVAVKLGQDLPHLWQRGLWLTTHTVKTPIS